MRVLVAYGSKMGGTEGIAELLAETLRTHGLAVDVRAGSEVRSVAGYDGVVVGGALYAWRWHADARRVVRRHRRALARLPVWLFSSGPLDGSAVEKAIPPTGQVQRLMDRIGARGHATFGGRMPEEAQGFPASAIARDSAGDWRDPGQIAAYGHEIAAALRAVQPTG